MPALEERVVRAGIRMSAGPCGQKRREELRALKHFDVDAEINILANKHTAGFHGLVPSQTECFAIKRAIERVAHSGRLVERVGHRTTLLAFECNLACGAADRKVSGKFYLVATRRSEEHTSELQSRGHLAC